MGARPWPRLKLVAAAAADEVQHHALPLGAVAAEAALPLLLGRCAEQSQLWEPRAQHQSE